MYKPKQQQQNTNRLRLDVETKMPSLYAIEQQFQEAKGRRGCLIELPWTTGKPNQLFILGVQWDPNQDLPIWTLYEQNNMESKMHWSEQYPPGDLQIMYDVVAMSVATSEDGAKIPDSLRPSEAASAPPPPPAPAPPPPPVQAVPPGMPYPAGYPPMPGQPVPYPMDPAAAAAAAMPPGYPYPAYYPGGAYPPPPPGWPYAAPPAPPPQPPAPVPQAPPAPPTAPAASGSSSSPVDYTLISKRAKVQLGKLLVDSKIISQTTLDAALKLQELVEDNQLTLEQAPGALTRYHTKGAAIGEFINLPEPEHDEQKPDPKKPMKIFNEANETAKLPITPPRSSAEAKATFDLLIKAGILSDTDMKSASEVRRKHGGDIIQILQSASKVDKFTFEAAVACLPLIELGLMKLEQCCIALQYCNRMRVDFDTALDELGWTNPRKVRKDLQL